MSWLIADLDESGLTLTAAEHTRVEELSQRVGGEICGPAQVYQVGCLLKDELDAGKLEPITYQRLMRALLERVNRIGAAQLELLAKQPKRRRK